MSKENRVFWLFVSILAIGSTVFIRLEDGVAPWYFVWGSIVATFYLLHDFFHLFDKKRAR